MDDSNKPTGVTEEAARWFVRLKDDDLTTAERREYLGWLKQAPAHVAEMLRITGVYSAVHGARLSGRISLEDVGPNVIELSADQSAPKARRWRSLALAACCVLAIVLSVSMVLLRSGKSIETGAGEWRHVSLEDGSFVRLGPRTRLQVDIGNTGRTIELRHGEATFQVAKDPARPFVVNAGLANVRALGTAFGIVRKADKVVVTVAEGSVSVSQKNQAADHPAAAPLSAGEQIAVSKTRASAVQRVDVARELAWAEGRLIFDSETLAQAVEEFNLRNRVQIEIQDPAIAARPVRGVFDAADPESFVEFLTTAAQVRVERTRGPRLVLKQERGDESRH